MIAGFVCILVLALGGCGRPATGSNTQPEEQSKPVQSTETEEDGVQDEQNGSQADKAAGAGAQDVDEEDSEIEVDEAVKAAAEQEAEEGIGSETDAPQQEDKAAGAGAGE